MPSRTIGLVTSEPILLAPVELGEVSFHTGWTFHRAGANTTDRAREVMTVIYMNERMRLTTPKNKDQARDLERWMPGLRAGDQLDSPLNPVLYRRKG